MRKPTAHSGAGSSRLDPTHPSTPESSRDDDVAVDRALEGKSERTADLAGSSAAHAAAEHGGETEEQAETPAEEPADAPRPGDSLIWPPPEEELNGWQIVQLETPGRTLIEPARPAGDAPQVESKAPISGPTAAAAALNPITPPPAPRLYSTIPTPPAALPLPSDEGLSIDRSLRADREPIVADPRPPFTREAPPWPRTAPPMHPSHVHALDENLPETQVIEPLMGEPYGGSRPMDPLAPTPARPAPAASPSASPASAAAAAPRPTRTPPQIIVQGGSRGSASGNQPTQPLVSGREQTHPRIPVPPAALDSAALSHSDEDTVDPSAQTRIMPIPYGIARHRVPASMVETLKDEEETDSSGVSDATPLPSWGSSFGSRDAGSYGNREPVAGSLPGSGTLPPADDPLATNVWPSPPMWRRSGETDLLASSASTSGAGSVFRPTSDEPPTAVYFPDEEPAAEPTLVANRRSGLWRVALIAIALLAVVEIAYLTVRTLRTSAGASVSEPPAAESSPPGTAPANPSNPTPSATNPTDSPGTSAAPASSATQTAALEVRSDPAGARVSIDGVDRGRTPVVVSGLSVGRHQVQVSGPFKPVTRQVSLAAGQRASVTVTPPRAAPDPARQAASEDRDNDAATPGAATPAAGRGWLTVDSPIVLRIVRNGDFLGTSEDRRIPLPAGTHTIALEAESVNFREVRNVDVTANRGVALAIALPQGALNINAVPWAEVFVDNQRIGETPVSQLALPIGPHEILYRHPQFGDRRVTVIVKVGTPGRTFVDFTK